jgi:hypothetical protein
MLSLMRTKREAELSKAAWSSCRHSLPGGSIPGTTGICPVDSRFQNEEGRS